MNPMPVPILKENCLAVALACQLTVAKQPTEMQVGGEALHTKKMPTLNPASATVDDAVRLVTNRAVYGAPCKKKQLTTQALKKRRGTDHATVRALEKKVKDMQKILAAALPSTLETKKLASKMVNTMHKLFVEVQKDLHRGGMCPKREAAIEKRRIMREGIREACEKYNIQDPLQLRLKLKQG